jgi:hypothetical protein
MTVVASGMGPPPSPWEAQVGFVTGGAASSPRLEDEPSHRRPDAVPRSRGAVRPSCAKTFRPKEGVGNAGRPLHPRSRVHLVVVERTRVTTSTPEITRHPRTQWFTAYFVLSPAIGLFWHRRLQRSGLSKPGRVDMPIANLTPTSEASGPHDFAVRNSTVRLRADQSLTGNPPCDQIMRAGAAASTASLPAYVTIAIRPSLGVGRRWI